MSRSNIKGISWNHSRAYPPLVAAAQRFAELNPEITITWDKRSLHEFGHASLAQLCARYDLIVVDHPMMGEAHEQGLLYNLKPLLRPELMDDMSADSVGNSYASYVFEDCLYALPLDAAAPAASSRPDLLAKLDLPEPDAWDGLLNLARRGLVRMPGFPADLFLNFMGLCVSHGATVAQSPEWLIERTTALECLEMLRELAAFMPAEIYQWNPIALYETMVATDDFAYCPFAYTYSNYSRAGFSDHLLRFSSPVTLAGGRPQRTVLGGTGLAIAKTTASIEAALAFALYAQSAGCQRSLYAFAGGQPARRSSWLDPTLNQLAGDFFLRTLPCMDRAYTRPRYPGYVPFQEKAGVPIADYLQNSRGSGSSSTYSAQRALDRLDVLYRQTVEDRTHA